MRNFLKIILIPFFISNISISAHAKFEVQKGTLGMNGEILESACTIDLNSLYQTIEMGNVPIVSILNAQDAASVEFEIKLVDCRWGSQTRHNLTSIDISFTGKAENNYFLVEGDAEGVYLGLESITGYKISPGEILTLENDLSHENKSKYRFKLLSNGQQPKSGSFETLIQFNVSYK